MAKRFLIGIDLGTTTVKVVFVDAQENKIAYTKTEEIFPIKMENPELIEYNANDWWEYTRRLLKYGFDTGIDPKEVAGICFCGWTVMSFMVKADGTQITNPIHYNDMRHINLIDEVKKIVGELAVARNGNHIGMYNGIVKEYWWKKNRPELFEQADYVSTEVTWMNHKLTGEWAWNRSQAGFYGQYDAYTREWDDEIIEKTGFSRIMFPKLVDASEVVGYVTEQAARETGLAQGTPVFGGADDASPVAITTGVITKGQCFVSSGSGGNIAVNTDKPLSHETLITYPHCVGGLTAAITVMSSMGLCYKWMRNAFGQAESAIAQISGEDAYTYLNAQAKIAKPGANGVIFLPYLDGDYTPNNDANARGVFIGMDTATTKNDMLRATLEGVAFAMLDNIMLIRDKGGEIKEIVLAGGLAKSELWLQIIADITDCPVSLPEGSGGASFGCAIIAGVGAGVFESFENAVDRVVNIKRNAFLPSSENHEIYCELYLVYKSLYPKLKGTFAQMADIREKHYNK